MCVLAHQIEVDNALTDQRAQSPLQPLLLQERLLQGEAQQGVHHRSLARRGRRLRRHGIVQLLRAAGQHVRRRPSSSNLKHL